VVPTCPLRTLVMKRRSDRWAPLLDGSFQRAAWSVGTCESRLPYVGSGSPTAVPTTWAVRPKYRS
jgi:hypothetical protein